MKKVFNFAVIILLLLVNSSSTIFITKAQVEDVSEDIRLTFTDGRSMSPAIAMENNYLHVVYIDNEGGGKYDYLLWYIRSSDHGNTWSSPTRLVNNSLKWVSSPKIAVHLNNIHVIWPDRNDNSLFYMNSTDNGNTWSEFRLLTSGVYTFLSNWDIGIHGNNLHVIYIDSNNKINYIQSNDNGNTWIGPKIILSSIDPVFESAIVTNELNIHVVTRVRRERGGRYVSDIVYTRSIDNGINWDNGINISDISESNNSCDFPDIAVANNDVYIIYRTDDLRGIRQIFYSFSTDNGITWEKGIKLSNSTSLLVGAVVDPAVAVSADNVCIVWEDFRNVTDGDWELYFKSSSDRGITWSVDMRFTNAPGDSIRPFILISENIVNIIWTDNRDGNNEIYYKKVVLSKSSISAVLDIKPDTLNLKSKGRWITAYIELSEGYDVNDINISAVLLENMIQAENYPTEIGDYDNDGIPDLMVKFDRSDVEDYLKGSNGSIHLTIEGKMITGDLFKGSDTIRVIKPPL